MYIHTCVILCMDTYVILYVHTYVIVYVILYNHAYVILYIHIYVFVDHIPHRVLVLTWSVCIDYFFYGKVDCVARLRSKCQACIIAIVVHS